MFLEYMFLWLFKKMIERSDMNAQLSEINI